MAPLMQAAGLWHEFHALLGAASATLVALLFVAASLGSGVFSLERLAPLRMFLSASVVHFSSVLVVSLIVLAPVQSWTLLGGLIMGCAAYGIAYSGRAWRDAVRDGLSARIDLEDRVWYAGIPALAYLVEAGAGVALATGMDAGFTVLAVATAVLLFAGIHNAWDITIWSITRSRD